MKKMRPFLFVAILLFFGLIYLCFGIIFLRIHLLIV